MHQYSEMGSGILRTFLDNGILKHYSTIFSDNSKFLIGQFEEDDPFISNFEMRKSIYIA
jgi:hypothetical protein